MGYWIVLFLAGCMEIVGVFALKKFTMSRKKIFLLGIIAQFSLSFSLLSYAMQGISMGVAYAVWTGIGAGGGVILGILLFGERKSTLKLTFVTLIILSSMGLKFLSS
ncbi:QacE family quaternary ammonium compound efflux SMR transporter [Helicobacter monodelphidis]|uniref:DMT family transporter n=1 Tax=Helicobacter sp. 15-1451 TaxID=2004995 RepID=UPI000DCF55D3|nr:multidrug efflux SMR transporter [Helicobacter sp. 15-1451]RAX58897.1 QacE family quaternary ammonium compound efflux SMR transporter [Helicobacter sp. 15-1451]